MSRPSTRNKNKKHQHPDDSEKSLSEILRRIHSTGEISKHDINQLYSVWKPVCQGCRVNSKENPNCFCALIPPLNGHRKSGLWQKNQDLLALGPDPCKDLRSSLDTPSGLTNLGATCYANSILQCLYMNTSFREGIFSLEPETLSQVPVLGQLARLFAQLHSSKMGFIDSAPFIKTLELDNGVQQDSHEFLTLFLSLLERSLGHSKIPSAQTIVQDLFRGSVSHVTRCSKCGKDSEASSKMEDFYELELNIKDFKTLDESLDQYLSVEDLQGENQYYCESCHARVDATRSIKLRSLPTVLNLQLKRYVFLPKTTTKKKITSSFGFPKKLDMTKRLTVAESSPLSAASPLMYELSAILIHKGSTVNSGHYVAHIKDELTGQWWEFDDEDVSILGSHPFGEKENNSYDKNKKNTKSEVNSPSSNGKSHDEESGTKTEMFSSTDAYMLMYKLCENGSTGSRVSATQKPSSSLPYHFIEEIERLNESYQKGCEEYKRTKDEKLAFVTERREEVRSVLSEAPVASGDDMYFWISAEWLHQWADNVNPPDLDNSLIQCAHGKVPVSKVNAAKCISAMAWQLLHSKYGGGPALSNEDYCVECLKEGAHSAVSADVYRDKKASLKQLAEDALAGKFPDSPSYFVSRSWLVHWLRRKNTEKPYENEIGPTSSLACPHGSLLPEVASGAKRVSAPEDLWLFLYETHNSCKVDMDDILIFPSDTQPCEICTQELSEVACVEDNLRATKRKHRENHEKLSSGKSLALNPEQSYYLVPSSWLAKWRSFVNCTGKNISSSPEPDNLETTIDSLMCEKHSKLMDRPLDLVCKRHIITQKTSSNDGLTIIPEADWVSFCEEWNVPESRGISCRLVFSSPSHDSSNSDNNIKEEKTLVGPCKDEGKSVDDMDNTDEPGHNLEVHRLNIKTQPEVCDFCIGERDSHALMKKLNYTNENIKVFLVRGKEAPKSIRDGSASSDPERRTSKRSRKDNNDSISLNVSGTTSVYQLKMMIWEAFGVVKENQKLHKGEVEIEGDMATLADKNIFPGDVLWVKDSEMHENRDIADEISDGKSGQQEEEGFRGTLLTSCNVTTTNSNAVQF